MRITFADALALLEETPLDELQKRAQKKRFELYPEKLVTYVLDSNPNYTNICSIACAFCAFWKKNGVDGSYHKSPEEVMKHLELAQKENLTTVLLQGGCHPEVTVDYLVSLVRMARSRFPTIHPHFFSAVEIWYAAEISKVPVEKALEALWEAGLRTIPGGGAEVLSEPVRKRLAPKKMSAEKWLSFHEKAHGVGFKTTATMMYGHIETNDDIVRHLEALRDVQDRTGGFSSFIPWSFKSKNSALENRVIIPPPKEKYFRILATARLYLDNFPHIAASWFGEGKEAGVEALSFGADDFGGILFEENVHKACDFKNQSNEKEVQALIRKAGFTPTERNAFYDILKVH